jgi:NADH-quinone oxidoreductase subunit J
MSAALFAAFAAVLLGASLMVILHRNPISSALFLVLAFCALAGIYLTLGAEFIGMVQIIVYAGAIMVLFLFVIMYLNLRSDVDRGIQFSVRRGLGWLVGAGLLAAGVTLLMKRWAIGPIALESTTPPVGNTQALGQVLYTRYLFPFEITSIVLLVAMVGAIVIAGHVATDRRPPRERAVPVPGDGAATRDVEGTAGGRA